MMQVKQSTWKTWSIAVHPVPSPTTFSPQRAQRPERKKDWLLRARQGSPSVLLKKPTWREQQVHSGSGGSGADMASAAPTHEITGRARLTPVRPPWWRFYTRYSKSWPSAQGPTESDRVELGSLNVEASAVRPISHTSIGRRWVSIESVEGTA